MLIVRVLLLGPNGAGKSTLVKMIMGRESPDSGSFTVGDTVQLACVGQDREGLDGTRSVYDEIGGGADHLQLGTTEVNARAYCSWFGFKVRFCKVVVVVVLKYMSASMSSVYVSACAVCLLLRHIYEQYDEWLTYDQHPFLTFIFTISFGTIVYRTIPCIRDLTSRRRLKCCLEGKEIDASSPK